jgi:hypothetical protein
MTYHLGKKDSGLRELASYLVVWLACLCLLSVMDSFIYKCTSFEKSDVEMCMNEVLSLSLFGCLG